MIYNLPVLLTRQDDDDRGTQLIEGNGAISYQSKSWGNPRHGYRCVREP